MIHASDAAILGIGILQEPKAYVLDQKNSLTCLTWVWHAIESWLQCLILVAFHDGTYWFSWNVKFVYLAFFGPFLQRQNVNALKITICPLELIWVLAYFTCQCIGGFSQLSVIRLERWLIIELNQLKSMMKVQSLEIFLKILKVKSQVCMSLAHLLSRNFC